MGFSIKNPNKLLGQPNTRVPAFLCSVYHCDPELFLECFPPSTCLVSCPLAARYFAFLSSSAHPGITAGLPPTPNTSQENKTLLWAFLVAQRLKGLPAMQETQGWEDPLEKGMATHSSTLAWRIPWREEPGRLQSTGSQRVRHD